VPSAENKKDPSPLRRLSTKPLIFVDPDWHMDKLTRELLLQFAEQLPLPCVQCRDGSMADQDGLAARCSRFDDPGQRVQPAREHQHAIRLMEGPVVLVAKLEVRRLGSAICLERYKRERICIIREKTEHILHHAFHARGLPELGLSNCDQKG